MHKAASMAQLCPSPGVQSQIASCVYFWHVLCASCVHSGSHETAVLPHAEVSDKCRPLINIPSFLEFSKDLYDRIRIMCIYIYMYILTFTNAWRVIHAGFRIACFVIHPPVDLSSSSPGVTRTKGT